MILIVDDHPQLAGFLMAVLAGEGWQAEAAASVAEALAKLDSGTPYEVLVSDFRLPDGTGADLARIARETRPGMPVLLMSGYDIDIPDVEFILKPFGPDAFVARIRSLLQ